MKATCQICRRHRTVMASARICLACSVGVTHTCPICLTVVPGSGQAPCYPCSQRRRAQAQITIEAITIPHPWLAELFTAFCTSGRIPIDDGKATDRIARAAAACRRIARSVQNSSGLTTDALHAALGAEGLRRVAPLIAYMTHVGALDWDRARLQTLIERDRVAAILHAYRDNRHAPLLHRYRDHLAIRDRKPITQRTALTAAVALLAALGEAPIADLSQRHITSTLRKRPGHRASLLGFVRFLASQGGPSLTVAKLRQDPVAQEKRLRADIRRWRKRLENPRTATEARALLAVLIARIYGLPLQRVLALRCVEVEATHRCITLWPDDDALVLGQPLARAFLRWIAWSSTWRSSEGPWVFPGRHRHQPLSETAIAYHLSEKGKDPR